MKTTATFSGTKVIIEWHAANEVDELFYSEKEILKVNGSDRQGRFYEGRALYKDRKLIFVSDPVMIETDFVIQDKKIAFKKYK